MPCHLVAAGGGGGPRINLGKLQTASLKRYGAAYHLVRRPADRLAATLLCNLCCGQLPLRMCAQARVPADCPPAHPIALPLQPAAEQAATTREQLLDAVAEHFAAQQVRPLWCREQGVLWRCLDRACCCTCPPVDRCAEGGAVVCTLGWLHDQAAPAAVHPLPAGGRDRGHLLLPPSHQAAPHGPAAVNTARCSPLAGAAAWTSWTYKRNLLPYGILVECPTIHRSPVR